MLRFSCISYCEHNCQYFNLVSCTKIFTQKKILRHLLHLWEKCKLDHDRLLFPFQLQPQRMYLQVPQLDLCKRKKKQHVFVKTRNLRVNSNYKIKLIIFYTHKIPAYSDSNKKVLPITFHLIAFLCYPLLSFSENSKMSAKVINKSCSEIRLPVCFL